MLVIPLNCEAFTPVKPAPLPTNALAVTVPEKFGLAGNEELRIVPLMFAAATELALPAVAAVAAEAALPVMLIAAVPPLRFAGFKFCNPPPSPAKTELVTKALVTKAEVMKALVMLMPLTTLLARAASPPFKFVASCHVAASS